MNKKKVIQILEKAQKAGAIVEIDLNKLPEYLNYKKSKIVQIKIKNGISLVQILINASNLDKAEKILNELEKISNDEKFMGAIWEKRGWIADYHDKWDDEIDYFTKAGKIYKTIPGSIEIEGYKEDRILTIEHFTARALYFRGNKSDLKKCEKLFTNNLNGYMKLKKDDAIGFNYSWLARTYIAMKQLKKAHKFAEKAETFFEKESKSKGKNIKSYTYRIKAEIAIAENKNEDALKYATESLRYVLPPGSYYNGAIEAVKCIIEASFNA